MGLDRIPKVVAIVDGPIMKKKEITFLAGGEYIQRFRRAYLGNQIKPAVFLLLGLLPCLEAPSAFPALLVPNQMVDVSALPVPDRIQPVSLWSRCGPVKSTLKAGLEPRSRRLVNG